MTVKTSNNNKKRKQRYLRPLVGAALLNLWMFPALADGTAAGTTIDNTAYGSFESPADPGTAIPVESNTVTLTIAEIAGIDVAAQGATEAPSGVANAGPGQGDSVISSDDVVYFTYRITNIGNDQTQFFIPDSPASVTNGDFDAVATGPIEIVSYNDGTTTTAVSAAVPGGGATTGTLIPALNGGSVPVDGYIEVRIPIKADSGLIPGTDQITVVLGNTPTAADQNVPFTAGGEFAGTNDVFTQDNPGTDNGDLAGSPSTEREASDSQTVGLGAPNLDYGDAPDISPATGQDDYQTEPGRGPSHVVDGVTFLGTAVDAENVAFDDGPGEDDGVVLDDGTPATLHGESVVAGDAFELDVTTAGSGVLNAWIDFNRDGDFDDPGEQVATDATPTSNLVTINSTVPFSAVAGDTYARFRYSSDTGLGPDNAASDGEVEDYQITIVGASPQLRLVKRVTRIGTNTITTVVDEPTDPDDDAGLNWPADYLEGDTSASAEPFQEVDYTIYFLSDGNSTAANVRLCDLVPDNTTYVPNTLVLSQGGGAPTPLTDAADADAGESFSSADAIIAPCQGTNTDGGVYVTLPGNLPNATAPGTPSGAYGYIRFTVQVD